MNVAAEKRYTIEDLLSIMEKLRSPEGCPWDREQTHQSIRKCFIEETYEAIEAIDLADTELLLEELGDVLFQVVFHSELEKEKGVFDFGDVVDGVSRKMIQRHPHVFGEVRVQNSADVITKWDAIKKETKGQKSQKEVLESVSRAQPALMRSAKVLDKASKGEKKQLETVVTDAEKALKYVLEAKESSNEIKKQAIGALLLSAVELSRSMDVEPEEALTRSCDAFIEGFREKE